MPFSESIIAKGLVFSNWEKIIMDTTVIGTLKIIPIIPHSAPQIERDKIVTNGLIFIELPMIFGSKKFPTITWIVPMMPKTNRLGVKIPNWNKQNIAGNIVAMSDPIVGMKFRIKIKNAQNPGASTPMILRAI